MAQLTGLFAAQMKPVLDNQVDTQKDMRALATSVCQLQETVAKQQKDYQDQIDSVRNDMQTALNNFEAKMKDMNDRIEHAPKHVRVGHSPPPNGGSSGSASAQPAPAPASTSQARSFTRDIDAYDETVLVITGLPEALHNKHRVNHGKELLKLFCPGHVAEKAFVRAPDIRDSYSIKFPSKIDAIQFKEKALANGIEYVHPKTKHATPLRIKPDKSVSARLMNGVLYRLYPKMEEYLKANNHWPAGSKLGSTGYPRKFCQTTDDHECFVYWEVTVLDSKEVSFKPREGLAKVGLSEEAAEAIVKQAILEAKESRQ